MLEFNDYIWNHREKCIQISTNMPGICIQNREIDVDISEMWENNSTLHQLSTADITLLHQLSTTDSTLHKNYLLLIAHYFINYLLLIPHITSSTSYLLLQLSTADNTNFKVAYSNKVAFLNRIYSYNAIFPVDIHINLKHSINKALEDIPTSRSLITITPSFPVNISQLGSTTVKIYKSFLAFQHSLS